MQIRYPLSIAVIAIVVVMFYWARPGTSTIDTEIPVERVSAQTSTDDFGIETTGLEVVEGEVRYGQVFSDLLTPHGIDYEKTVLLASKAEDVFDVRQLKANRPYRVYLDDSLHTARYLTYALDQTSYVTFDITDMSARVSERPIRTEIRSVSGRIDQSLYVTLVDQGIHPLVAVKMANVFAWQIDFTRLHAGDSFRVLFEDRYVGDERIEPGSVLAATFHHRNREFQAFRYQNGDVDDYYDETGKSIRKAFLIAPVEYSRISSSFSLRRFHPVQKRYKAHLGTDYAADYGTPIVATGDGVVTEARFAQFNGNYVKIRHNAKYTTQYLHMSRIAEGIRPGVAVKQGETIGYVGSTGLANGNHVCYRFWVDGKQQNHRTLDLPSVGPIPDAYRADFVEIRDARLAQLSSAKGTSFDPTYAMLLRETDLVVSP